MKLTKSEKMYRDIEAHGDDLNRIFNTGIDSIILCKKLRKLERSAQGLAERFCNYGDDVGVEAHEILSKVIALLGKDLEGSIFINFDPRGYALKIDDTYVREHSLKIYRDWGGYGILAPDFSS